MNATSQTSETVQGWEAAFPSGEYQFVNTAAYRLPVDYGYVLEQTESRVRIQNFISQDGYGIEYPDQTFFIEITPYISGQENIADSFTSTEDVILAGKEAIRGNGRLLGGETWPGHSYYLDEQNVYIGLFYLKPAGEALAEAVIQQIHWNE